MPSCTNKRKKSVEETYIHSKVNKRLHFGEYSTSRIGNRKITYSVKRKSQILESEVTTSFENHETNNHDLELRIDENSIRTLDIDKHQESILSSVSDDKEILDNHDEGTSCDSGIKPIRFFNELGNISPDNFAEPNDYNDFIIENNDIIDLTSNDDLNDKLSVDNENYSEVDSTVINENYNEVDSTVTNNIVDKDILDNFDAYDVNRLWKSEEMETHLNNKILMSVQDFNKIKEKIITKTSFVEDEIMGAHTVLNISIDGDLTQLENEKNDKNKNNNQKELIIVKHKLPVRPVPSIHEKSVNSTSSSDINQIFQKQIALSENDPKKKEEQARIFRILMQNKLINEETRNLMKNKINQAEIQHKRSSITEYASKQDENNPSKRLKPSDTVTKLNNTLPTNPKDIVRNRIGSPLQGNESKLNSVLSEVSSNQNKIRIQPDKNIEIKQCKKSGVIKSSIRESKIDKKEKKVVKKQNNIHQHNESGNKNVIKNQNETVDTKLRIDVHESKKNDQKVTQKVSFSESNNKYESSKKNVNDYSKKDLVSPPEKSKYAKLEKECLVRLERCDDKNDLKHHISQENSNINKKRKNENSDKTKDEKSKKHRDHSHKSTSHHKSLHSSSKHKSSSKRKSSSSKTKITAEDKITNDLNEPIQLADLTNKAKYTDYKIQHSDSNQLKMKLGKIREESTNQVREILSTSEQVYKPCNNDLISIEERLELLERGNQTTDKVSITNGMEPCVEQHTTPSPEISTSCVTPPAIINEELPEISTVNIVPLNETNIMEHVEIISSEGQNLNLQNTLPIIEQESTEIVEFDCEKILLNNVEIEQMSAVDTQIDKHCESTIKNIPETIVEIKNDSTNDLNEPQQLANLNNKANHNDYKIQQSDSNQLKKKIDPQIEKHGESSNKNVPETIVEKKIDPEIPIIDLTIPEFIKKEEPLEDDIIEVQDVPMLRVKASVFLSEEANNIIEKIKTCMSFTCTDVRTFNERIRILTNRMDKTREEVLKTEHIESRALAIQPILANNLHYFNDTNMFKALTQSINDLSNEKFTIDHVEHVFQLLLRQSPVLRKEFLGSKSNELSNNRPSSAHNSIVSSSNIPYNASTNLTLQQPLHNNNSISNQTYSNIPNNLTMAYSNTIGSSDGQESNYLINSSVRPQSNGYYNPQSAQINDSYQVRHTNIPLAINSAKNNNIINSPTSQISNNLSPTYNNTNALPNLTQMVKNPNKNDNYYSVNNTSNNYLIQQRIENTQKYNTDMYISMNSPYANNEQQQRQNPQAHSQFQLQQAYQLQTEQYERQKCQEILYQQHLNNRQVIQNYQRQPQVQYQSGQQNQQSLIPNQPQTENQQQPDHQQQLQQSKLVHQTQSMAAKHQSQLQQVKQNRHELQKDQTYLTMLKTFQRQQLSTEIPTTITEHLDQQKQQHFHNRKETETGRTSSIAVGNSINRNNFVNSYYLKPMSNKNINGEENLSMPNSREADNVQDVTSSMPNTRTVIGNGTVYPLALSDSRPTNVPGQSIATTVPTTTFSYYALPVSNHIRTTNANLNSFQANTNKT